MKVKLALFIFILLLISTLFTTPASAQISLGNDVEPLEVDLVTGRKKVDVGDVSIWNDNNHLFVKYQSAAGWKISETHLAVTTSFDDIPQTRSGNPKNGKFQFTMDHNPAVQEYTYQIELNDWKVGTELFIAAHSVVNSDGRHGKTETAWAEGTDFPGNNWAMYLTYTFQQVFEAPNLPDTATILTYFPGDETNSYWTLTVSDVDDEYDLENQDYAGWCIERFVGMYPNREYDTNVSSSFDEELPKEMEDHDWNKINYLLNHKDGYTIAEIQLAIWYFLGEEDVMNELAEDAELNGGNFWPAEGQVVGIILDAGAETQMTLIELIV